MWRVRPEAWLFLAVITTFNLILSFMSMIGTGTWSDVSLSIILKGIVLIYIMLPGVRRALQMDRPQG